MGLEVQSVRPLARLVVRAVGSRPLRRTQRLGQYSPHPERPCSERRHPPTPVDAALSTEMVAALFTGEFSASLTDWMDPDIAVWSPTVTADGRDATLGAFVRGDADGDTLAEIDVEFANVDIAGCHVYVEWSLSGRFTNPCFVDEDLLIEPTGRLVELSGVLVTTIANGRAVDVHCYYDDMALLEQLLLAR